MNKKNSSSRAKKGQARKSSPTTKKTSVSKPTVKKTSKKATKKTPTRASDSQPAKKKKKRLWNRKPKDKQSDRKKFSKKNQGDPNRVRVIPLGGVEEVGSNLLVFEIGTDLIVCDVGFEFISDGSLPGVDYLLPNTKYLEDNKHRVRGAVITHGHLDHIGGVPFLMERIGNPPIYTRRVTAKILEMRQQEFPEKPKLDIRLVKPDVTITIGKTKVTPFEVTHSIPDSMGISISTKQGNIVVSGDFKLDHRDGQPTAIEKKRYSKLGQQKNLLMIADSTNAEQSGFSVTEREVQKNIADVIEKTDQRLIIGTFASQMSRLISIIKTAQKCKKKIVLEGRSILNNVEIAKQTGMISVPAGLILTADKASKLPRKKTIILATGAQGEEFAALNRIAQGQHPHLKLDKHDVVLLSSSVIPGNERAVQSLKDSLLCSELQLITYRTSDVHSTGHGNSGELVWINKQVKPKYFMPGYGFRSMVLAHANAVVAGGFPRKNVIFGENGLVVDFVSGSPRIGKKKVDHQKLVVEKGKVGLLDDGKISERQSLASHGVLVIGAVFYRKTRKLATPLSVKAIGHDLSTEVERMVTQISRALEKKALPPIKMKEEVLSLRLEKAFAPAMRKMSGQPSKLIVLVNVI